MFSFLILGCRNGEGDTVFPIEDGGVSVLDYQSNDDDQYRIKENVEGTADAVLEVWRTEDSNHYDLVPGKDISFLQVTAGGELEDNALAVKAVVNQGSWIEKFFKSGQEHLEAQVIMDITVSPKNGVESVLQCDLSDIDVLLSSAQHLDEDQTNQFMSAGEPLSESGIAVLVGAYDLTGRKDDWDCADLIPEDETPKAMDEMYFSFELASPRPNE
ncbi:MAG: hypothetical protein H7A33_07870 [Deltaproteobacteria bacterium]|nr:hypothetical protein [Deltaproteobacteria bacterium]